METLRKARLTALHAICVQIFRHIAQKSLAIRQYACGISMQSAEKSDYASYAQALCSVSIKNAVRQAYAPVGRRFLYCVVFGHCTAAATRSAICSGETPPSTTWEAWAR